MATRTFSYRNFSMIGYALVSLTPTLFVAAAAVALVKSGNQDLSVPFGVMTSIGLICLYFTVKHLMLWANERIVLTDQEIDWIDWTGRTKVRSPIGGIVPGSLSSGVALAARSGRQANQTQWTFKTSGGEIRFRSTISNCSDLLRELERLGAVPGLGPNGSGTRIVGTYHAVPIVAAIFVGGILMAGMGYAAFMILTGRALEEGTHHASPPAMGLPFAAAAIACTVFFIFAILAFVNERIVIDGDQIYWRDKLGRDRVRCTSHDIVPMSFTVRERYNSSGRGGYYIYRVMTRMGPIKFDSNMTDSDMVAEHLRRMSDGTVAGTPYVAPAESKPHWTGDPLDDPQNADNIPIR